MKKISGLDPRSGIYHISQQDAEALLVDPGAKNRRMRIGAVNKYARRMKMGHWRLSGEPIILNEKGKLLDGEHRLRALAISGKEELETVVLYGDFSFTAMGQGAARSGGDALSITNPDLTRTNEMSAMITMVIKHERAMKREMSPYSNTARGPDNWMDIENDERISWFRKNPGSADTLLRIHTEMGNDVSLMSASTFAAAWWLIEQAAGAGEAEDFMVPLISGIGLKGGDVRLTLRRSVANRAAEGRKLRGLEGLHWIAKAWDTRKTPRKPNSTFAVKQNEEFPFIR